jgi:hypothetical protein
MAHLVIATVDGVQIVRLMLGWSPGDVEMRARYYWRNNTVSSLEVHQALDVTVPEDWQPTSQP